MSVAALSTERIEPDENAWTRRLVLFLRVMALVSIAKGLYHWAQVTGFVGGEEEAFENQTMAWQTATIYFAGSNSSPPSDCGSPRHGARWCGSRPWCRWPSSN